jgi:hypothetical protein
VALGKRRQHLGDEALETCVPIIVLGIKPRVRCDHPADVARPVRPDRRLRLRRRRRFVAEKMFDRRHRRADLLPIRGTKWPQHRPDGFLRAFVEGCEFALPGFGETQRPLPRVACGTRPGEEAAPLE